MYVEVFIHVYLEDYLNMQNYTSKWRPSLMVSRDGCVALPRGAMGLSAVCDCGIS